MDSFIPEIKDFLLKDKRKSERLLLPFKIAYSVSLENKLVKGSMPVKDIGGHGLQFISAKKIDPGNLIDLRLMFPEKSEKDIPVKGSVIRCEKISRNAYSVGVSFHKMCYRDRQRFIEYLSGKILLQYLTTH